MGLRAIVGVPLRAGQEIIGVLGLTYLEEGRTFGSREVALLMRFGRLASLALENARLYSAARDELGERRRAEEELQDAVGRLKRSEHDLRLTRQEMVRRLSYAAEYHDPETGRHVERVGRYCGLLGRRLGLAEERCELLRIASALHDVGKIAIADSILLKPGPLTPAERKAIEQHAEIGQRILAGSGSELLDLAATIAWTHHERFDGTGYPRRIAGEAIPLEGRIVSVADVFDALTSERVYRPAFSLPAALKLLEAGRGSQFDPLVLDVFLEQVDEVMVIRDAGSVPVEGEPARSAGPPPVLASLALPERERRSRRRAGSRWHASREISIDVLESACEQAEAVLFTVGDDRQAIDAALARLRGSVGPELLASVYVREHDRIWLLAQRGYEEVRDGFSLDQGIMARAVRTGSVQFIPDVELDPDFILATGGVTAELALPLGDGTPAAGVLNIELQGRTFPVEALALFGRLAGRLEARAEAMRADLGFDLAALARLFVYASSLRGVEAIAEFATRTLGRLLGLEAAQLNVGDRRTAYVLSSFWRSPDSQLEPMAPADLERIAAVAEPADAAYSLLDLADVGLARDAGQDERRLVWLPLRVAGTEIGILVGRAPREVSFEHEQAEAAILFAPHAAALIDAAQALRREQRAAVTDSLTGLLNRRGFDERFREELERAARAGRALSVVILDCDDFKSINDLGGHAVGDAVLQSISRFLRVRKRAADVAARLGGDEFTLLLPELDGEEALAVAERLRTELVDEVLDESQTVTATFGVASYPGDGATATELLRAADRALYAAKDAGRNRTLAFSGAGVSAAG